MKTIILGREKELKLMKDMKWLTSLKGKIEVYMRTAWGWNNSIERIYELYMDIGIAHWAFPIPEVNIKNLQQYIKEGIKYLRGEVKKQFINAKKIGES